MSRSLSDAGLFGNLIAENVALRKALEELLDINERDEKGDPDYLATDQGREDAWQYTRRALSLRLVRIGV